MALILVVEDERTIALLMQRLLTVYGHTVILVADGQSALVAAKEQLPNLIVMDMGLPILTGWDAVPLLRTDAATAAIPIIALTAFALTGDRERALAIGCTAYLSKPFEFEEFRALIQQHLPQQP